jgi:purine-binding chemotaxis protein CheW
LGDHELSLICRVLDRVCALPLASVIETMRPLPIEPLPGVPRPVAGVALIRGATVPVVDLGWVLSEKASSPTRFVTMHVDGRQVALAVESVVGVRAIPDGALRELPPLLQDASSQAIAAIGTLDAELLVVLGGGRLVPDMVWRAMGSDGVSP